MSHNAPGEARTLDLRISSSVLTYKYDALTDCATGALLYLFIALKCHNFKILCRDKLKIAAKLYLARIK